jgi:tyrosine-protein phosphatase YwqE
MLNWFHKKTYLVDSLGGFVDIHNHILPGIDDGAESVEASIALVQGFGEMGIQRFIATPHILNPLYPNTPETIGAAHQELGRGLMDHGLTQVSVEAAAEHMIDDAFEELLEVGQVMPMRKSYLLVEMSYLQPSLNFEPAITAITRKGLTPILAHPERYAYLHQQPEKYREYRQQGILFQLNLLSLDGYYGRDVQKMAWKLIEEGLIDFLASDAHGLRHLEALKDIQLKTDGLQRIEPLIIQTIEAFY